MSDWKLENDNNSLSASEPLCVGARLMNSRMQFLAKLIKHDNDVRNSSDIASYVRLGERSKEEK